MRRILRLGAALLVASALVIPAGCAKKGETIRLAQFLTDPVLIAKINGLASEIEKRHPGLHIEVDDIPYNNYQEKLTTLIAAGNCPDVIYVEVNNFVNLYLLGALQDLAPYCRRDNMDLKDYYPGVLHRFSPGGQVYAIPQDTAPSGLVFYNRKFFREAGIPYPKESWTWSDFLSDCQKLVKKDASGRVTRWAYVDAYSVQFENFLFSNGANYVDDTDHPTRMTLDSPRALEAIDFRWALIHKYHVSPDPSQITTLSPSSGQEDMFSNGQAAMISSGIWQTPRFLQNKNLDFDVVEFPRGPHGDRGWGTGGSGYAMSKSCKDKDLAWMVIQELTSAASVSQLAETGMIQPALKPLAESDVFLKSPGPEHKGILLKMPAYSHYEPFMADWNEIYNGILGPALDPVWLGKKTPEQVVPAVNQRINQRFFSKKQ